MARLKDEYNNKISKQLMEELGYNNPHAVPALQKIVLNMGVGRATKDKKEVEKAAEELTLIAGQKAVITHARRSIAGFGLGKNAAIGVKVTLRNDRMYEFLDKLSSVIFPRTRDFKGLPLTAFDGKGNYSIGLTEQVVFPEIDPNTLDKRRGLQIILVTNAKDNAEGEVLLRALGLPFEKEEPQKQ